jgi:hypothetical protein
MRVGYVNEYAVARAFEVNDVWGRFKAEKGTENNRYVFGDVQLI